MEEEKERKERKEEGKEEKVSDRILIISIGIIIFIILSCVICFTIFKNKEESPKTVDELHLLNLKGKLKSDVGYIYKGYSFVFLNDLWYTQIQTESGKYVFSIPLHYAPMELETIQIEGKLDYDLFNSEEKIYITFNPLGDNLQYVALAIGEFDQNIIKTFRKLPVAACDRNESDACKTRPIITCNNTNMPVLYVQQKKEPKIVYDNNCIIVQGEGMELIKAMDRLLLGLYRIME